MAEPADALRSRWSRARRVLVAGGAALLVVILLVAGWLTWLVGTDAGHRRLLDRVAQAAREVGVELRVESFSLDLRQGRIELRNITLGAPGGPPLLRVAGLVVVADLGSLTTRHIILREIRLERPSVDLTVPIPAFQGGSAATGSDRTITVERFAIVDGGVRPAPLPSPASRYLTAVSAGGIEVEGSFRDEKVAATIRVADITAERPGVPAVHLAASSAIEATMAGDFAIRDLVLSADGLALAAGATGRVKPALEVQGSLTADIDAARLAPDLATGGRVHLAATGTFPGPAGEATLDVSDLRLEDLQRVLPELDLERLGLGGAAADLHGRVKLAAGRLLQPTVSTTTTLRRAGEVLATADIELAPEQATGPDGVRLRVTVDALPALPGRRHARGAVVSPSLAGLANGRLEDAEIQVLAPAVVALHGELARRFPALVPALPEGAPVAGALDATVTADGPLRAPRARVQATWLPTPGGRVELAAEGLPTSLAGSAAVTFAALPAALARPGAMGTLTGTIRAEGSPRAFRAQASLQGTGLAMATGSPAVDTLRLEASTDGRELTLGAFDVAMGQRRLSARGRASLALPLADAALDVELEEPVAGIRAATVHLALDRGVVRVEVPPCETAAGPVAARLEVPLGAIARVPGLGEAVRATPVVMAEGPVHLQLWAPRIDTCEVQQALGLPERPERASLGLATEVWLDPADLPALIADVRLENLRLSTGTQDVTTAGTVRLSAFARRVELEPVALLVAGTRFETTGEIVLRPGWQPADPMTALVTDLRLRADGEIPTELATPYLVGGVARGNLMLQARAAGPPDALRAAAHIEGPEVSLYWPTPYATRIEAPAVDLLYANGELAIENGHLRLNGGDVQLSGKRYADGFLELHTSFAGLAYRLDYGVAARLSGDLDFALDPTSRGLLAGRVVLERGLLDRDLDLEREVLPRFLAPVQTTGTGTHVLDTIDMDVSLATVDGLRVANNLADLRMKWEPLEIGGTLWNPVVRGRVEVEPGGRIFALGQTIELDRGVATFTGDPVNDPRLDFSTRSSGTSILGQDSAALDELQAAGAGSGARTQALGVAGYFGERLTRGLGEKLGLSQVSIRPMLVFGEADPSARLTLTRELSRQVALAVSVDLRSSQRQTYLLDLHGFRKLPRFVAQGFSNDEGHQGATLQQVLELGGTPAKVGTGPEVDGIVVTGGEKEHRKLARRAVRVEAGTPLPDGAGFDVEVEVVQALRDAGYPEAAATVSTRPAPKHPERVELVVTVTPGPQVVVEFEGDRPPAVTRRTIAGLYRIDAYEAASREEMRVATVRALRSLGFLDPRVEVAVAPGEPRVVTVASTGGARVGIELVAFAGLPQDETELLARRFAGPTERTELAAGLPDARRRVEESLHALGFPEGRLVAQRVSEDGKRLDVELAPGPQDRIAGVEVQGVDAALLGEVIGRLPLRAGTPARADLVAAGAVQIEQALQSKGFADVRVHTVRAASGPGAVVVRYEAKAGRPERLASLLFTGQRSSSEGWLRRTAGLQAGDPHDPLRLGEARGRLLGTNVFSSVTTSSTPRPDGGVDVTFALQEKPRFSIAYGARWESEVGWSGVVDLVDRNLLGRALVAGLRARWEPDDQSGRLYLAAPRLLGAGSMVEAYLEARRTVDADGFITDSGTGALQLSRPFGRTLTARLYGRYSDWHLYEEDPDPFFPFDLRVRHPYLGVQLIHDTREDPVLGIRGMLASLDVSGSGPFLGSDYEYLRGYGQVNTFVPIGRLAGVALTWAQSVRAGLARAFAGQTVVLDARFKTGGEYSVRGYPFESLGPTDVVGDKALGGDAVLVINEEFRFPLPWDMSGLVFFDAGQVWAETSEFGRDLATAVGLGLRADTPVGVIRLDLARPLDRRPGDPSFKLYLGLGNAF